MLKDYRRHFILSNMLLSGIVLLITFAILGAANYRSAYSELENTMSVMLRPWNSQLQTKNDIPPNISATADSPMKPEKHDRHEASLDERRLDISVDRDLYELFTTVIYHTKTGDYTVLSHGANIGDELIPQAVSSAISMDESFGKLPHTGLMYYVDKTPNDCKIVLIGSSYILKKALKSWLFLALVYLIVMSAILFISMKLSKTAVKPLEQAIDMERNFVADISHDLKTPITIVLTNNSILTSNPDMSFSERKQWTDSTEAAAKNMMKLVNEMLTLSSLESVERHVEKERVSLSMAAEKCVLQLESLAYESEITVEENIEDGVYILSSPEYTERICSGLIDNALKYEPRGGTITVSVKKQKKAALISVSNKGSFISQEDLPHIFERFYRGDKARSSQKGHGLGLPIISRMTELVGAKITAESSETLGTRFTVVFDSENLAQ